MCRGGVSDLFSVLSSQLPSGQSCQERYGEETEWDFPCSGTGAKRHSGCELCQEWPVAETLGESPSHSSVKMIKVARINK